MPDCLFPERSCAQMCLWLQSHATFIHHKPVLNPTAHRLSDQSKTEIDLVRCFDYCFEFLLLRVSSSFTLTAALNGPFPLFASRFCIKPMEIPGTGPTHLPVTLTWHLAFLWPFNCCDPPEQMNCSYSTKAFASPPAFRLHFTSPSLQ